MRNLLLRLGLISSCSVLACQSAGTPAGAPPASAHEPSAHAGGQHHSGSHSHQHGMHKDFSDAEGFAKAFDDPERDAWQHPAELVELMRIEPGSVVADLGAGTGYFVGWLSRAVGAQGKVLALDVEPKMVEFLGKRAQQQGLGNVLPRLVPFDDPQLEPGSVSRVLIVNTWHHIDDRSRYAAKLAPALAAGGEIWVVDFTLESELGPPVRYRLSPEQVVAELQGGGLRAEVVTGEQLPRQYVVRAVRP
jgi:ubiquinone/menaquinone biosynthesis C-methylase UbiE